MKTLKLIFIFSLLCLYVSAQHPDYRVEKIVQVNINSWDNSVDTIVQSYKYQDSILTSVEFISKKEVTDFHTYIYSKNKIVVQDKNKRLMRSYMFNSNNTIAEYWNDNCDKFTFLYSDDKIRGIDRMDKCDQYNEGNNFEYAGNKLSKVKTYIKSQPGITTDYVFTYANDTLKKIIWGNNIDLYVINRTDNIIESIEHSKFGNKDWKKTFTYDSNSNIIEERYYAFSNGVEKLEEVYLITYSKQKGNDSIVWKLYDWKINLFINQRTYKKFIQRRY